MNYKNIDLTVFSDEKAGFLPAFTGAGRRGIPETGYLRTAKRARLFIARAQKSPGATGLI